MNYILTLEATEDGGNSATAKVGLVFPKESSFAVHTSVATAFNYLIPLLLGDVVEKLESKHALDDAKTEGGG